MYKRTINIFVRNLFDNSFVTKSARQKLTHTTNITKYSMSLLGNIFQVDTFLKQNLVIFQTYITPEVPTN